MGFLKTAQLSECLKLQQELRSQGVPLSLSEILLKQQYLTDIQIHLIEEQCAGPAQGTEILIAITPELKHELLASDGIVPPRTEKLPAPVIPPAEDSPTTKIQGQTSAEAERVSTREIANLGEDTFGRKPIPQSIGRTMRKGLAQLDTSVPFGRYKILEQIGQGGMGKVYKAYDPNLDRIVALKILMAKTSTEDVERFLREAKATAKLRHPNIVAIYDIGCENGQEFFTMDFIEGPCLHNLLKTARPGTRQLVEIMAKIGEAIAYAHSQGIIHRDLKPANIMMERGEEPKVMDFGLAKLLDEDKNLSKSGTIIGTLQYMPPEQAQGKMRAIDEQSDVYSLGAILYEMMTGRPPFTGPSMAAILDQILHKEPVPPSQIRKSVSKDLENICLLCLQKNKEDRYPKAADFVEDLQCVLHKKPVQPGTRAKKISRRLPRRGRGKEKSRYLAVAVIVLCAMIALALYVFSSGSSQENRRGKDPSVVQQPPKHPKIGESEVSKEPLKIHIKFPVELQSNSSWQVQNSVERMKIIGTVEGGSSIKQITVDNCDAYWDSATRQFESEISLAPGKNEIEIWVSDVKGNSANRTWAINRLPLEEVKLDPRLIFKYQTTGQIHNDPLIVENCVYWGSIDGNLYAFDIPRRQVKWKYPTRGKIYSSPAAEGGIVCFGSADRSLYALEMGDGKLKWKFSTGGPVVASPTIRNGVVYCGSDDGCLYALQLQDGSLVWKFSTPSLERIQGGAGVFEDQACFGSFDGHLYALDLQGKMQWDFKTEGQGAVLSTPVKIGNQICFGSMDGSFYSVDSRSGKLLWHFKTGNKINHTCGVQGNTVYVGNLAGCLHALDVNTGALQWKYQANGGICYSSPSISDGMIYFGTHDSCLYALDLTGNLRWKFKAEKQIHSTPAFYDGNIYFGCDDGNLYAIRKLPPSDN